jgi:pectate lyase
MRNCFLFFLFSVMCCISCAQQKAVVNSVSDEAGIAFPGAEGFGKYTTGGRGGKVMIVSNLNDDGAGSFRDAVEKAYPRIIVFAVSGTIHLESKLNIKSDVTIAGQTAPGDGICLADQPVSLNGDNIVIRYLRFRMGDKYQNKGMVDGGGADDAFGGVRRKNIIIDHCSMSWSTDEVFSVYAGDSTTLQWNFIYEPLNYSYHFETGDKDFEHHGFGGIWGGRHLTAHHNLFAHCNNRNPRFDGIRNAKEENVDYRNNVIYNWGQNNIYAGEGGNYNLVNNYFKYGPSTKENVKNHIANPYKTEKIPFGKWFADGNYIDGAEDVSKNNSLGIHMGNNGTEADKKEAVVFLAHPAIAISSHSAQQAYEAVLKWGGCSLPTRDTLDERIAKDVKHRTGRIIDVQGGYLHGTKYELTVNAWPALKSLPALKDSDSDGIPDDWEKKNGLNPTDAADVSSFTLNKQYTNIEVYINTITPKK